MRGAERLVENLFRTEAGRLVASLGRLLGPRNLDLAEDVVADVLCHALEVWKYDRVPDNPAAWLARAARNRAVDAIRRESVRRRFSPDLAALLGSEWTLAATVEARFEEHEIADDQLRMMFTCCAEAIAAPAQVALILKLLCGFSVQEIAAAFLASEAAIEKQLARGRKLLARSPRLFEMAGATRIRKRLVTVQRALYLLFNEGYHGSHPEAAVRKELCADALRLTVLLAEHRVAGQPSSLALAGLMCLHAARLPGRLDAGGALLLLDEQDRSAWDRELIERGLAYLERSGTTEDVSAYHVEAAIAAHHAVAPSVAETNWHGIVALYDLLGRLHPGPVVALNRAIAVGQAEGPEAGLAAIAAIDDLERLAATPFLAAARADLHRRAGRLEEARLALDDACARARNPAEAALLRRKRDRLDA